MQSLKIRGLYKFIFLVKSQFKSWLTTFLNVLVNNISDTNLRSFLIIKKFKIHSKNIIFGRNIRIPNPTSVEFGSYILINNNFEIIGSGGVAIDDYVYFAPNVTIITAGHDVRNMQEISGKVVIERLCWIGANVMILPNVIIGEGSIVGAGAVVTKSISPYSIVAGNPAVYIKRREIKFPYRLPGGRYWLDEKYNIFEREID